MKNYSYLILIGLIFFSFQTIAQEYYSVIAENGLAIRENPSASSKKLGKLHLGENVLLIEKSKEFFSVEDKSKTISGKWFKVSSDSSATGYVFSGYLLKKNGKEKDRLDCYEEFDCNATLNFENFKTIIYNYQTQDNYRINGDTTSTFEWVFNEVGDKLLRVIPKNDSHTIKVFYTFQEGITEQYNRKKTKFEDWLKTKVRWVGHEDFRELKGTRNFFIIPIIKYEEQEKFRKDKMNLRDTLIDLSGESWNIATLIYKDKPCTYGISPVILKISLFEGEKEIDVKYIKIDLSFGC